MKHLVANRKTLFGLLFSLSIFTASTLKTHATEAPGDTNITCPDGNKYVCATVTDSKGTFVAYKGDGGTVVTL